MEQEQHRVWPQSIAVPTAHRIAIPAICYADVVAVSIILIATAAVAWNRFIFDWWLSRHDLLAFFLPWYSALGDRLRDLDVPGWNPYVFSGAPFAGDPESGWMYVPAMLAFSFLPATAAFKAMVVIQLVVAGVSTYALARVLGMGIVASLVGATVFEFGPFLYHNTDCCTVRAQVATFIPLTLLGVELALGATSWRQRIVPWFVAGFGISQILGGWLGQGALNALLLVAAYVGYRALLSPPVPRRDVAARLTTCISTGLAILAIGLMLGAAGVLPRLDVNQETNLAGANYEQLDQGHAATPYTPEVLFSHLAGDGSRHRAVALGGAAIILSLLAPILARRRYAVPFFAGMTIVIYALTQAWTPLHPFFYLIPRFQSLHEHSPHQINAVVMIGPAMLTAAGLEGLRSWRGKRSVLPLSLIPFIILVMIAIWLWQANAFGGWPPIVSAGLVTALAALMVTTPYGPQRHSVRNRMANLAPALIFVLAFLQPTGQEVVASSFGWMERLPLTRFNESDRIAQRAVDASLASTDPAGAGEFLQTRQAELGPFRYVGYGGVGHSDPGPWRYSYQDRRLQPDVVPLLVNGRSMVLELQDIQGYNPIQLQRYVEFMTALNGVRQDYHHANLLPSGTVSPLLNLLNVRYIVVSTTIPQDRADVVTLTSGRPEVFRTDEVVVHENPDALPRAWVVHGTWLVEENAAAGYLNAAEFDPREIAIIEGPPPEIAVPVDPSGDSARVTRYEADAIDIDTRTDAPGLLVVSEVYSSGWKAYVDGEPTRIIPTNHALRSVRIPAGQHTVALRYQPDSLYWGLAATSLSSAAMVAVFLAAGWEWARRQRRRPILA
jgi:hypothetical protein